MNAASTDTDLPPDVQRGYRPCVGLMVVAPGRGVFIGERVGVPNGWQMPQGGIDPGETAIDACMREMGEEIGTSSAELLCEHDDWLYYDIPLPLADRLWQGRYKGQKQKWMALRFTGDDSDINIVTEEPEFCEWKWLSPHDLVDLAVPFKRDVYQNVLAAFAPYLK